MSSHAKLPEIIGVVEDLWRYPSLTRETLQVNCATWRTKFDSLFNNKVSDNPYFDENNYYDKLKKDWKVEEEYK